MVPVRIGSYSLPVVSVSGVVAVHLTSVWSVGEEASLTSVSYIQGLSYILVVRDIGILRLLF